MKRRERVCRCGAPIADERPEQLCVACVDEFTANLDELGALLPELDTTIARQYTTAESRHARSGEQPLPYDQRAADVALRLLMDLRFIARRVAPVGGVAQLDMRDLVVLLRRRRDALLVLDQPTVTRTFTIVSDQLDKIKRVIDRPADQIFVGACGRPASHGPACQHVLYAEPGARSVKCPRCGASHDVERRRAIMRSSIDSMLFTIAETARLIAHYDEVPTSRTLALLKSWQERGKIKPRGHTAKGVGLYRFDEMRKLVMDARMRRSNKRKDTP